MNIEDNSIVTTDNLVRGMVVISMVDVKSQNMGLSYIVDSYDAETGVLRVIEPMDAWMGVGSMVVAATDRWYVLEGGDRSVVIERAATEISRHRLHLKQCKSFLKELVDGRS